MSKSEKKAFKNNPFLWFAEDAHGVWVVLQAQSGVVDHLIAVDTREALIFDISEDCAIKLFEESLRLCGGDDVYSLKIEDVCEIFPQRSKLK